jgi:hypothetical protein
MSRSRRRNESSGYSLESRLLQFGVKLTLGVMVAVVFLTMVQCTVKEPAAPTWTTQFTLPLINRTYEMGEIVSKINQDGIEFDADSNIVYTLSRDIDTFRLDAGELTTSDVSCSISEQLGVIEIEPPASVSATVSAMEIGALATYLPGTVPPTSFEVANQLEAVTSYSSATIAQGQVLAISTNNLGFDLASVSVELYDVANSRTVGTPQTFSGGLLDGETDTVVFDLAGETVSNSLDVRLSASTLGGLVLSASGKEIITTMMFGDVITVTSATAEIQPLNRSFSQQVVLGESDAIYNADFSSGSLTLDISNETNLPAELDITFPDFVSGNAPLNVMRAVGANTTVSIDVPLTTYSLRPSDSTVPQNLNVEVIATVEGSLPGQPVAVDQTDQFSVSASLSQLEFGSVTGVFDTVATTIAPSTEEIAVPEGFDQIALTSVVLTLEVDNGVNMPGNLVVSLLGNNGKSLTLSGAIAAGSAQSVVTSTLIDSTAADFLNPIPSKIQISGSATFGDGVTEATITTSDFLSARVNIVAPLEVTVNASTIEADIDDAEIDQDNIDLVTDHFVEARLIYNVTSHFPLGAQFNICLSGDSASVYTNPGLIIEGITFGSAPTVGGIVSDTASTGFQEIVLSNEDLQVLKNDTLYIGTQLLLEDTNGESVRLTNGDYVTLVGRIEVDYLFDGEF